MKVLAFEHFVLATLILLAVGCLGVFMVALAKVIEGHLRERENMRRHLKTFAEHGQQAGDFAIGTFCGCYSCEEARKDLGLQPSSRWRAKIPKRYC